MRMQMMVYATDQKGTIVIVTALHLRVIKNMGFGVTLSRACAIGISMQAGRRKSLLISYDLGKKPKGNMTFCIKGRIFSNSILFSGHI